MDQPNAPRTARPPTPGNRTGAGPAAPTPADRRASSDGTAPSAATGTVPPVATGALRLDQAQQQVVDHAGGPLLVLAGPGTGKTTTIVATVADRIGEPRHQPRADPGPHLQPQGRRRSCASASPRGCTAPPREPLA